MKIIFTTILIMLFLNILNAQSISGVVTYFFNDNYGNKPDVGSTVYIVDSASSPFISVPAYDSLKRGLMFYSMYYSLYDLKYSNDKLLLFYKENLKRKKKEIQEYQSKSDSIHGLMKNFADSSFAYGINSEQIEFTDLDHRLQGMVYKLETSEDYLKKTIDGSGNYFTDVKPGTYYIIIRSAHRKSRGLTASISTPHFKKVTVKDGQSKDVSYNFEINY